MLSKEGCASIIKRGEESNSWRFLSNGIYHYHICALDLEPIEQNILKEYCLNVLNIELTHADASLMKYQKGDYIRPHIDRFIDTNSGTPTHTRMLYNINVRLNDDFEGGEFYLGGVPYYKNVGQLYHYRSDQVHEVKPILSGVRYTVLFYIKEQYIKRKNNLI